MFGWRSGAWSNRRPSAFQGFYQPETMIRRNTADHSYLHWHWSEGSYLCYQPCHRVPHNPVSSVGLLWGTTRTPDLWGFCGAAASAPAASRRTCQELGAHRWRGDPASLPTRIKRSTAAQIAYSARWTSVSIICHERAQIIPFWDIKVPGVMACFSLEEAGEH